MMRAVTTFVVQLWNTGHRGERWDDANAYPVIAVIDNRVPNRTSA